MHVLRDPAHRITANTAVPSARHRVEHPRRPHNWILTWQVLALGSSVAAMIVARGYGVVMAGAVWLASPMGVFTFWRIHTHLLKPRRDRFAGYP